MPVKFASVSYNLIIGKPFTNGSALSEVRGRYGNDFYNSFFENLFRNVKHFTFYNHFYNFKCQVNVIIFHFILKYKYYNIKFKALLERLNNAMKTIYF